MLTINVYICLNINMSKKLCMGFTLIELLVVIAIIGILAGGVLVAIDPIAQFKKSRDAIRKSDAKEINDAIARYFLVNDVYPDATACSSWCNSGSGLNWIPELANSNEVNSIPIDPLNNAVSNLLYYYRSNGSDYCVQISFETDMSANRNYFGPGTNTWALRYGPNAPNTGQCAP